MAYRRLSHGGFQLLQVPVAREWPDLVRPASLSAALFFQKGEHSSVYGNVAVHRQPVKMVVAPNSHTVAQHSPPDRRSIGNDPTRHLPSAETGTHSLDTLHDLL